MIAPKFIVQDVAKDGSAILVKDDTGSSSLYSDTGYGSPNMLYTDFTRYSLVVNRYDESGTEVVTKYLTGPIPATDKVEGDFDAGVYNLCVNIGARSTTPVTRVPGELYKAQYQNTMAGLSQVDASFLYVSDDTDVDRKFYKVLDIAANVITFEEAIPDQFTQPVFWYESNAVFISKDELVRKLIDTVACGCECSPKLIQAYCNLVKAEVLVLGNYGNQAYQHFTFAKNLINTL